MLCLLLCIPERFCHGDGPANSTMDGNESFGDVVGRLFFQDVEDDGLVNITCKMHESL